MTLRVLSINVHIVVKPFKYNKAILINFFYFRNHIICLQYSFCKYTIFCYGNFFADFF